MTAPEVALARAARNDPAPLSAVLVTVSGPGSAEASRTAMADASKKEKHPRNHALGFIESESAESAGVKPRGDIAVGSCER
jgi:hypothetical protein